MLFHNDSRYEAAPQNLILPGCGWDCPLFKWADLLEHVMPYNYTLQCHQIFNTPDAEAQNNLLKGIFNSEESDEHYSTGSGHRDSRGRTTTPAPDTTTTPLPTPTGQPNDYNVSSSSAIAIVILLLLGAFALIVKCLDLNLKYKIAQRAGYSSYDRI